MKSDINNMFKKVRLLKESVNRRDYLAWKRKNVTLRGISEYGEENNAGATFGRGLYTAFLSNKSLARKYGKVYFVLNAIPKKPKVVDNWNEAEIFIQKITKEFCDEHGVEYDSRYFAEHTTIEEQMLKRGFDGLVIKGREIVNYKPDEDAIRYFKNEKQLEQYYYNVVV